MRNWGLLVGILLIPMVSHAGQQVLAWDYDREYQFLVTYVAHITMVQHGRAIARDEPLALQGQGTCAAVPGIAMTPESLCAYVCLDPGVYTIEVMAVANGERSPLSEPYDADLQQDEPCQAPPPPKPDPKPAPKERTPINLPPPPIPLPDLTPTLNLADAVNLGCVSWKITGACLCPGIPPRPCVTVSYYEPAYIVETVPRPGTTMIPGASQVLQGVLGRLGLWGAGGAGNATGQGHTNKQYNEVHIFQFPQFLGGPCTSCLPRTLPLGLHYASELDAVAWRTATGTNPVLNIGPWARLYPRGGTVIHSSPPVGSAVAVVRALDIAHQPIGLPPAPDAHIVTAPIPGMVALTACMQMSSPRRLPCFQSGTPNALWEAGTVDIRGNYSWIIWVRRTCCVDIDKTTCGITLPGVGRTGENWCVLPQIPTP